LTKKPRMARPTQMTKIATAMSFMDASLARLVESHRWEPYVAGKVFITPRVTADKGPVAPPDDQQRRTRSTLAMASRQTEPNGGDR
jgi:hypothetical protein